MDYDYFKNHYRLTAGYLSWQKELGTDKKAIQQIEFVEQLKIADCDNADGEWPMFILTILEKKSKKRDWNYLKGV